MKKNRTMRVAVLMLALTLLTCCFVGSTFAKYTSSATGSSTATVAKWHIELNGQNLTTVNNDGINMNNVTFDLFKTINDTKDGNAETDVKTGLIAPGTKGSFAMKVDNLSEVNATYKIAYTEENTENVPVVYSLTGEDDTWVEDITELNMAEAAAIGMGTGTATVTVYWMWDFEGDDTQLGIDAQTAAATVKVTATITVDQVD